MRTRFVAWSAIRRSSRLSAPSPFGGWDAARVAPVSQSLPCRTNKPPRVSWLTPWRPRNGSASAGPASNARGVADSIALEALGVVAALLHDREERLEVDGLREPSGHAERADALDGLPPDARDDQDREAPREA